MITLSAIAKIIEDDLNTELKNALGLNEEQEEVLGDAEIRFRIYAVTGDHEVRFRRKNTLPYEIEGNLRLTSSMNEATDVPMGINRLSLDFLVPVKPPRTNAAQTEKNLPVRDERGEFAFVNIVLSAIDTYFANPKSFTLGDEGEQFSVSLVAGTAVSGTRDLHPILGDSVEISVAIDVYFMKGGISSKDVTLTIDGEKVPFLSIRFGRIDTLDRDVYSGTLRSSGIASSSAVSIDLQLPAGSDLATKAILAACFNEGLNTAHFAHLQFGSGNSKNMLITAESVHTTAQGVSLASIQVSFVEAAEEPDLLQFPSRYSVYRIEFVRSESASFKIQATERKNVTQKEMLPEIMAYAGGKFISGEKPEDGKYEFSVSVREKDLMPDGEGKYYTIVVFDRVLEGFEVKAEYKNQKPITIKRVEQ